MFGHRDTQGECYVTTAAETEKMPPLPGKECHRLPAEVREGKRGSFPKAIRGSRALLTPWFWTYDLQNWERTHFCCVKLPSLWCFVMAALGSYYIWNQGYVLTQGRLSERCHGCQFLLNSSSGLDWALGDLDVRVISLVMAQESFSSSLIF